MLFSSIKSSSNSLMNGVDGWRERLKFHQHWLSPPPKKKSFIHKYLVRRLNIMWCGYEERRNSVTETEIAKEIGWNYFKRTRSMIESISVDSSIIYRLGTLPIKVWCVWWFFRLASIYELKTHIYCLVVNFSSLASFITFLVDHVRLLSLREPNERILVKIASTLHAHDRVINRKVINASKACKWLQILLTVLLNLNTKVYRFLWFL